MTTAEYQPLLKAIDAYLKKADDDLTEMFEDEGRAEPQDSVKAIGSIEDKVEDSLSKETNRIISAIKKHKTLAALLTAGVLDEIFSDNTCRNEIKEIMADELNALVPKLVKCYVRNVDAELKINSVSKRTLAWIDNWSGELADMMKLSDKETISKIIQDGFTHGNDIASVTRAIQESGIRDEYYRARRVAVTEVLRADNVSKQEAAMQNPCIKEKMWRHTGAHKNEPRENHVAMDGQIVAVDQPFTLTGKDGTVYYPMCPVDPSLPPEESINCHCVSQDIVDEDILGMPLEERQRLQQEAIDSMDAQWEEEFNAKNKAKAGIEENVLPKGADNGNKIKYNDVTSQWKSNESTKNAAVKELREYSVNGNTYKVDDKHVILDYSPHEKEIAELISSAAGKVVHIVPRINYPLGISTPDYIIDDKKYDLKTIAGESKNVLYNAVSKKKLQSNNFVFDVSGSPLTVDELTEQIGRLYTSKHTRFIDETIMVKNNNIIFAAKRKTEI